MFGALHLGADRPIWRGDESPIVVADRDDVASKRREFLRSRLVALLHREPEIARPRTFERDG
jgi:hypothetical protein